MLIESGSKMEQWWQGTVLCVVVQEKELAKFVVYGQAQKVRSEGVTRLDEVRNMVSHCVLQPSRAFWSRKFLLLRACVVLVITHRVFGGVVVGPPVQHPIQLTQIFQLPEWQGQIWVSVTVNLSVRPSWNFDKRAFGSKMKHRLFFMWLGCANSRFTARVVPASGVNPSVLPVPGVVFQRELALWRRRASKAGLSAFTTRNRHQHLRGILRVMDYGS